ncbi:hypothetical protein CDD81_4863 [Ophiocordyceps australis]|uniref:DUF218 domain-containing protein n=1 Tax=Ophiocordyceps australis TaxID=1399860 RepID=A0A2C5XAA6_9HYPO|nr:hypothetical protein CDD81_4863 [Ophiocordyceps australis]
MAPTHLVVVCCHGIWTGGASRGADEAEWLIAPFQRGETDTFIAHARAGIELLAQDPDDSVVVFSGGPTRKETRQSEASSYALVAQANQYWDLLQDATRSILLEERALDSYHNVLFSLTLFYTRFSRWPETMTLVGHGFKRARLEAHVTALGFPGDRVRYIGLDPPGIEAGSEVLQGVKEAEEEWREDVHGRGERLAGKRRARNPWRVWQGVFVEGSGDAGGLVTRRQGHEEMLDEAAARPW